MAFMTDPVTTAKLAGTKWISPVNDNCFGSLCFISERTVMYCRCEHNLYAELGYEMNGDKIEIRTYGNGSMDTVSKMVLTLENGILKQPVSQGNDSSKDLIIVPNGVCN